MSQTTALAKARNLRAALLDHGVPEVSIELMAGRPTSFGDGSWDSLSIVTNFGHHVVSSYSSTNLTPVLALVKRGRTDVPGPLANGYGGWDLCYRIITFGYANHPGAGGPYTINNYTIPKDSARRYAWGTEWEGGIRSTDWDRMLRNPRNGIQMTMREMFGRAHAGIQDYFGLPLTAHMEHSTWAPTRKIDRLNYTRSSGIAEIDKYNEPIEEENDVSVADARVAIATIFDEAAQRNTPTGRALGDDLAAIFGKMLDAQTVDIAAAIAEVAPGVGLTAEQIQALVDGIAAKVGQQTVKLDITVDGEPV